MSTAMRWVDQAMTRPHRCAVVPYVGNGRGNAFIDTGQDLDLEHVYISDVAAEHIASEMLGWVSPVLMERAQQRIAELESEIQGLAEQLAEADRFADAAEYTLEKFGTKVRQKPGRKAAKKEEVSA